MSKKVQLIKDLDAEVEIDGERLSIRDLVETIQKSAEMVNELDSLREFMESTRVLLERGESELRVILAAVHVWRDLGWSADQIDRSASDLLAELKARDSKLASDPEAPGG